jgi:uncharacterized membrane protein YbhN (UPF0104 family)
VRISGGSRRRLSAFLFLGLALVFVGLLLRGQWTSLEDATASLRDFEWNLRPAWLLVALAVAVADLLLMGTVWGRLFRRNGGTIAWWQGVRAWVITNLGRYIPGKIWQLGGLAVYMRDRGDSGAAALVAAAAFQVVVLTTGSVVAVATVGVRIAPGTGGQVAGAVALLAMLAIGLHPAVLRFATRRLGGLLGELDVPVRLRAVDVGGAAAVMTGTWILYGVGFRCLMNGLGVAGQSADVFTLTGIFAASYVVGYSALVAPGGLVVREGAMTGLLVQFAGLSVGVAAAVAIAARVWAVLAELVAAGLVLGVAGGRARAQQGGG